VKPLCISRAVFFYIKIGGCYMARSSDEKHNSGEKAPLEDIDAIAKAKGTTRAKVLQDSAGGTRSAQDGTHANQQGNASAGQGTTNQDTFSQEYNSDQFQSSSTGRQDGYSETQGTDGQSEDATQAQDSYDPTHSGVRHAQNRPGTRPPTPGRETGTSWGEDQQMGATTDTPDRKNPAG
jgi:hypothetical protein